MCVYLDVTQLPRDLLDRKLAGILEIYEKFQGADPRTTAMKIFPAVHYSMGGLWCDYEANAEGGLDIGSPRNQQTNVPGAFAIGECDYQFHGANRLGANSLVACLFSGLTVAPGIVNYAGNLADGAAAEQPSSLFDRAVYQHEARYHAMLARPARRAERLQRPRRVGPRDDQGRHGDPPQCGTRRAPTPRCANWRSRPAVARWPTRGGWANQEVVFARALEDMFPLAKTILKGALGAR